MMIIPLILALLAMASIAASMLIARLAWPKFKALERRGDLRKPVPVQMMGAGSDSSRGFGLFWLTPIPADRPQLKRLVLAYRAAQITALLLMFASAVAIGSFGSGSADAMHRPGTPPPVTLPVQDH